MGIVLEDLRPMYNAMRQNGLAQTCIDFCYGGTEFDVLFLLDGTHPVLLFGPKENGLVIRFAVHPGFKVDTEISVNDYKALREALRLELQPTRPFSLRTFLLEFGRAISPDRAAGAETPQPPIPPVRVQPGRERRHSPAIALGALLGHPGTIRTTPRHL